MAKLTILIDMDQVLVDFTGGVCRMYGICAERLDYHRETKREWEILKPLEATLRENGKIAHHKPYGLNQFWADIHAEGQNFWTSLEPLPHFTELLDLVTNHPITEEWHVASSPSRESSSYSGKVAWLKSKLGNDFDRFVLTPHKHLFAGAGRLLIDDRPSNLTKFCDKGGIGILFPSEGSVLVNVYQLGQTVQYLEKQLNQLHKSFNF